MQYDAMMTMNHLHSSSDIHVTDIPNKWCAGPITGRAWTAIWAHGGPQTSFFYAICKRQDSNKKTSIAELQLFHNFCNHVLTFLSDSIYWGLKEWNMM